MKGTKCYACGTTKASVYLRVFGKAPDGTPRSWICDDCDRLHTYTKPAQPDTRVPGRAAVKVTTILRAERLAAAGHGWTADQVLRNALDMLEHAGVAR